MTQGETQLAATARIYASLGWKIFPLWWTVRGGFCACPNGQAVNAKGGWACSRGKHPLVPNGVSQATDDAGQVAEWWGRWPWANIGLGAGANGLAIVDVDPKHGGDASWAALCQYAARHGVDLTSTLMARTGSGGLHAFYAAPVGEHAASCPQDGCRGCIRNGQGNRPPFGPDMPGLDTRGHGGYVVAAPSRHASGVEYDWINFAADPAPWWPGLTVLMNPPKPPQAAPARPGRKLDGTADRYAQAAFDGVISTLAATQEGGRNAALFHATARLAELVAAGKLDGQDVRDALYSTAIQIGLGDAETRKTIDSGMGRHGQRGYAA
jgi:hypothetical protein